MGTEIDPSLLSDSGERCLRRILELYESGLPAPHLITAYGTAVEVHVSEIIDRLTKLSPVSVDQFGIELIKKLGDQMAATWPNRHHWIQRGFGVAYLGTSAAENFDTLVQLRNAIVHGDGMWSPNQKNDSLNVRVKLKKAFMKTLDVAMQNEARFGQTSREKASLIVREFVAHFDQKVLSKYPSIRLGGS